MNKVDPSLNRAGFFPAKDENAKISRPGGVSIYRNSPDRAKELAGVTGQDAKVDIPEAVKDFAKIKKAVDGAPDIDNSKKISDLKNQINSGAYKINYDALADKMLGGEF